MDDIDGLEYDPITVDLDADEVWCINEVIYIFDQIIEQAIADATDPEFIETAQDVISTLYSVREKVDFYRYHKKPAQA